MWRQRKAVAVSDLRDVFVSQAPPSLLRFVRALFGFLGFLDLALALLLPPIGVCSIILANNLTDLVFHLSTSGSMVHYACGFYQMGRPNAPAVISG
jgi:hypothetical protein